MKVYTLDLESMAAMMKLPVFFQEDMAAAVAEAAAAAQVVMTIPVIRAIHMAVVAAVADSNFVY